MTKAKELFDETTISNMQKAMILFKEDTDIIKEELDYAEKCHNLEEELGCPLDVFFQVIATKKVYIELPQFNFNGVYFVNLDFSTQDILSLGFYVGSCKLSFSDYKKAWWLRKDKSE